MNKLFSYMDGNPLRADVSKINLAIVSNSMRHREHLNQVMKFHGLNVVANEPLREVLIDKLPAINADVMLLDVDEHMEKREGLLEKLLDSTEIPIIFNDATGLTFNEPDLLSKWYSKLMSKIADITGKLDWDDLDLDLALESSVQLTPPPGDAKDELASNIWVLGASLGGPEALKQFLTSLPKDLPVAFILAQHLGASFLSLLVEQLDRVTKFKVMPARAGHVLRHGQVVMVPTNERVRISPIGAIELHPLKANSSYSPSIDVVMADMAKRYTHNCNAIIFSGMCSDGVNGSEIVTAKGGQVWTQSEDSCVISAMPDIVRESGFSQFQGTPRQLAGKLIQMYRS